MGLDPTIYRGLQQRQAPDLIDMTTQILGLRDLMERKKLRDEQLKGVQRGNQQQEREIEGQKIFSDLVHKNMKVDDTTGEVSTDRNAIKRGLIEAGFSDFSDQYEKSWAANRKALFDMDVAELSLRSKKAATLGQLMGPVIYAPPERKGAIYSQALQRAQQLGIEGIEQFPQYSPEIDSDLESLYYGAWDSKELYDKAIKDKQEGRAEKEHEARLPGLQADTDEKQFDLISTTMGPARSAVDWAKRRQFLAAKLPADLLALIPEEYSPEAVQDVRQLADEALNARTIISGGRVLQYNPASRKYDIDLGESEGALYRTERSSRLGGESGKALTPSQALSVLRFVQSKAKNAKTDYSNPQFAEMALSEIEALIAQQEGYDLEELRRLSTGQSAPAGSKDRRTMPDGSEWEKVPGGWKRVK